MKKLKKYSIFNIRNLMLVIGLIIFAEILILSKNTPSPSKSTNLQSYAQQVLEKCRNEKYRPSCYDTEIPKLMDYISMEEAFKVTSLVQDEDKSYSYCHVLGHKLSAREIDKDPSKWKDVVSRCPSGMCSNGCIHGGFQQRFRAENFTDEQLENLKPDLLDLCEQRANFHPTGLEQASCYHALGHLTMYLTSADVNKSTKLCEELAIKNDGRNFSRTCFEGVFMQIYQPLEPEDFALIKGKEVEKAEVANFCAKFDKEKKAACLSESWPLFTQEINTPEGLVSFCSKQEESEQQHCFDGMIYVLTAQFNFESEKVRNFCLGLPTQRQSRCFANGASRMIETDYRNIDKAVKLCSNAQSEVGKNICFEELLFFSTYNFHSGSPEFFHLCNTLPSPYKEKCLSKG